MKGTKIMNSRIRYGFLGVIISGSVLSLELYGLDFLYAIKLLSQGEVPVAYAIGLIMQFPINIAFGISVVLFFTAAFILISGLKSQNS